SQIGLAHYDDSRTYFDPNIANEYVNRIAYKPEGYTDSEIAREYLAICESGWDANPRFEYETYNNAAVDLNSLLYAFESNMAYFADELDNGESEAWTKLAADRKATMIKYLENKDGLLVDYNFEKKKQSEIFSVASIYPLFVGLADEKHAKAVVDNLNRLEREYGLLTCEENDVEGTFQWDAPNGWACLQYIAIIGLDNYGYKEEARRVAEKYVLLVEKVFKETDNLWEKYNVVEGNVNVKGEYEMPPMMGWSAGTYLAALDYLNK
ncbi:MAG: alpha,alpha-trehalase, partial [Clostridia bacterium]|nr:alpha,alpha-trehalase [Clostridia bacterium]